MKNPHPTSRMPPLSHTKLSRRQFLGTTAGALSLAGGTLFTSAMPAGLAVAASGGVEDHAVREIGSRRELFVDRYLIDTMRGARLALHEPCDEGSVLRFDAPWEGAFSGYCTVIHESGRYRACYRGKSKASGDGVDEVSCVAESSDGIAWSKPKLGLVEIGGSRENNVVLAAPNFAHNFSPLLDANPAAPAGQRYKALGGTIHTGLVAFVRRTACAGKSCGKSRSSRGRRCRCRGRSSTTFSIRRTSRSGPRKSGATSRIFGL